MFLEENIVRYIFLNDAYKKLINIETFRYIRHEWKTASTLLRFSNQIVSSLHCTPLCSLIKYVHKKHWINFNFIFILLVATRQ